MPSTQNDGSITGPNTDLRVFIKSNKGRIIWLLRGGGGVEILEKKFPAKSLQ